MTNMIWFTTCDCVGGDGIHPLFFQMMKYDKSYLDGKVTKTDGGGFCLLLFEPNICAYENYIGMGNTKALKRNDDDDAEHGIK